MKLVAFLYLLMRDSLPCGEVARLEKEASKAESAVFTNTHLEAYARELAARLIPSGIQEAPSLDIWMQLARKPLPQSHPDAVWDDGLKEWMESDEALRCRIAKEGK